MYITGSTEQSYLADVVSGQLYCLETNSTDNYLAGNYQCFLTHVNTATTWSLVSPNRTVSQA